MLRASLVRSMALLLVAAFIANCGGGGSGPGTPDAGNPGGVAASKIFVGDSAHATIGSSANSNPSAGTLTVDRTISGVATQLTTNMFDFAMDAANDRLYVADLRNILVFDNASTIAGNVAPSRVLTTLATSASFNGGIYLDTAGAQRLYAATNAPGATQTVLVFDNASTATNAPATRTITLTIRDIMDIAVDPTRNGGILYVYGHDAGGFAQILAFDNASTLNAAAVPNRTITVGDSGGTGTIGIGMFLDAANDRLYFPRNNGTISVLDSISTLDDSNVPVQTAWRTINLNPITLGYSVVFVETTSNRLYTLDPSGVNVIASASTVSGTPGAITRAIAPVGSIFRAIWVKP